MSQAPCNAMEFLRSLQLGERLKIPQSEDIFTVVRLCSDRKKPSVVVTRPFVKNPLHLSYDDETYLRLLLHRHHSKSYVDWRTVQRLAPD